MMGLHRWEGLNSKQPKDLCPMLSEILATIYSSVSSGIIARQLPSREHTSVLHGTKVRLFFPLLFTYCDILNFVDY